MANIFEELTPGPDEKKIAGFPAHYILFFFGAVIVLFFLLRGKNAKNTAQQQAQQEAQQQQGLAGAANQDLTNYGLIGSLFQQGTGNLSNLITTGFTGFAQGFQSDLQQLNANTQAGFNAAGQDFLRMDKNFADLTSLTNQGFNLTGQDIVRVEGETKAGFQNTQQTLDTNTTLLQQILTAIQNMGKIASGGINDILYGTASGASCFNVPGVPNSTCLQVKSWDLGTDPSANPASIYKALAAKYPGCATTDTSKTNLGYGDFDLACVGKAIAGQ